MDGRDHVEFEEHEGGVVVEVALGVRADAGEQGGGELAIHLPHEARLIDVVDVLAKDAAKFEGKAGNLLAMTGDIRDEHVVVAAPHFRACQGVFVQKG
ncbi:hypothetical protein LBMAG48_12890 [Phycisphaerae bacterium]|nr:hypothetical protein LBMAG48_12890 [Phycisphaerae bacterium]